MRFGDTLILVGATLLAIGLVARFGTGLFGWFGHLPGDIRHEGERTVFFAPITSMLLLSAALTLVLNLVARWLR